MTEDEKKSALAAAKARIAKHAVGAAMAATTLTPNLASAQTAEHSADFSPTPVEQTINATPSQAGIMSAQEAANMPAFGSKEWLNAQTPANNAAASEKSISFMQLSKYLHETIQSNNDNLTQSLETFYSPTDDLAATIRKDDFAKSLISASNSLTFAKVYTDLKAQGITEITNNGSNIPLEEMLTDTPELQEIITQENFSLDNPECVEEVIRASENSELPGIELSSLKNRPQTVKPEASDWKSYDQKAAELLKNVPCGKNQTIDLTSFRNELDTSSPEDAEKSANRQINTLQKRLNSPCENQQEGVILTMKAQIGDLTAANALALSAPETDGSLTFDQPHQQMKSSHIEQTDSPGAMAWQLDGKIYINSKFSSEEIEAQQRLDSNKEKEPMLVNAEFMKNNHIAQTIIALHESCHLTQSKKANNQNAADLPSFVLKRNTFIEKEAFAVEHLAVANLYSSLKEKGVTTLQYTDKDGLQSMPIDDLPKMYPGLKEAIGDGFSPQNPEDVRRVVKTASATWDDRMKETYKHQATAAAEKAHRRLPSFSAQLELAENAPNLEAQYDKDIKNMLSDVYISGNIAVNLNHCRDLLDTGKPEDIVNLGKSNEHRLAKELLTATLDGKKAQMLPKETLLKLNKYMETLGLKTNQEKDEHLKNAFMAITTRSPEASQYSELKNILLENGGTIKYADGLTETRQPGSNLTAYAKNNGLNIILPSDKSASQLTSNTKTTTINPVLLNNLQHNR